jgi:hypothetical protein
MDNERHGFRVSGNYATYQGRVYFRNRKLDGLFPDGVSEPIIDRVTYLLPAILWRT